MCFRSSPLATVCKMASVGEGREKRGACCLVQMRDGDTVQRLRSDVVGRRHVRRRHWQDLDD